MVIKRCNRASYISVFGNCHYKPPIAVIYKTSVVSYCNRVFYNSGFKKRWYRLLYYGDF